MGASLCYLFTAVIHSKISGLKIWPFPQDYEILSILACLGQIAIRAGRQAGAYMQ